MTRSSMSLVGAGFITALVGCAHGDRAGGAWPFAAPEWYTAARQTAPERSAAGTAAIQVRADVLYWPAADAAALPEWVRPDEAVALARLRPEEVQADAAQFGAAVQAAPRVVAYEMQPATVAIQTGGRAARGMAGRSGSSGAGAGAVRPSRDRYAEEVDDDDLDDQAGLDDDDDDENDDDEEDDDEVEYDEDDEEGDDDGEDEDDDEEDDDDDEEDDDDDEDDDFRGERRALFGLRWYFLPEEVTRDASRVRYAVQGHERGGLGLWEAAGLAELIHGDTIAHTVRTSSGATVTILLSARDAGP